MNSENSRYEDLSAKSVFTIVEIAFIIFVALAVVSYFFIFTEFSSATFLEIYFFAVFSIFCVAMVLGKSPTISKPKVINNKLMILILLILISSLGIRFFMIPWVPLWGDEISQSMQPLGRSPFEWAASQQQPPLSYFLSAWTVKLFGLTDLGIRGLNFLLGSFLAVQFFLFTMKRIQSFHRCLIYAVLFFSSPLVLQYSIESRTLTLGLIFAVFLFDAFIVSNSEQNFKLKSAIIYSANAFFLLSSTGFQSFIFLLAIGLLQFFIWLKMKRGSSVILGSMIGLISFIPIQLHILKRSENYMSGSFDFNVFWANVSDWLFSQNISLLMNPRSFLIIFFLVTLIMLSGNKMGFSPENIRRIRLSFLGFLLTGIFILLGLIAFFGAVNYQLKPRYLILALVPFYFSVTLVIEIILTVSRRTQVRFALVYILASASFVFFTGRTISPADFQWRHSIPDSFRYLVNNVTEHDVVIPVCDFNLAGCWEYFYFRSYLQANEKIILKDEVHFPVKTALTKVLNNRKIKNIYFLFLSPMSKLLQSEFQASMVLGDPRMAIFRFDGNTEWTKLEKIAKRLEEIKKTRTDLKSDYGLSILKAILKIHQGLSKIEVEKNLSKNNAWEVVEFREAVLKNERIEFKK